MSTPQSRLDLERILASIDAPRALVVLVDEAGEIESADKNLGPENVMLIAFSLAHAIAQDLKTGQPETAPQTNGKPLVYLPPRLRRKLEDL